jgi:hypothetical protein
MRSICGGLIAEEDADVWVNDDAPERVGYRRDRCLQMIPGHHYEFAPGWSI